MTENIIIPNLEKLEKIKQSITKDGVEKLLVLADFDKTLTKAFVGGKSIVSLISILRDGNYLTPDYAEKAHALYNKYHAIEIDPKVNFKEKEKKMHEWWAAHYDLLIKSGLNKRDIKKAVESGKVELREGFGEFAEILHSYNIPLVILSASGLGTEAIAMYLEKEGILYDNVHIVSNEFVWDEEDNAVRIKQPIIHSLNKSGLTAINFPFFETIKNRKNILLLGDSPEDAEMINGFDYDNLIKIGFLNEKIEENIEKYKVNFHVLVLNDASMGYINELLRQLVKN